MYIYICNVYIHHVCIYTQGIYLHIYSDVSFEMLFLPAHVTAVHGLRERCHGRLKTVELQVLNVCLHVPMHPCFHSGTDKIVVIRAIFSPFQ